MGQEATCGRLGPACGVIGYCQDVGDSRRRGGGARVRHALRESEQSGDQSTVSGRDEFHFVPTGLQGRCGNQPSRIGCVCVTENVKSDQCESAGFPFGSRGTARPTGLVSVFRPVSQAIPPRSAVHLAHDDVHTAKDHHGVGQCVAEAHVLQDREVDEALGVRGTAQGFAMLVEDVKGRALTLTLLSGFLSYPRHVLHQAGRRAEAETRFREAEQMRAERQPDYPLLYSRRGFQYCDLLPRRPQAYRVANGSGERMRPRRPHFRRIPRTRNDHAVGPTREGACAPQIESGRALPRHSGKL